MSSSRYECRVVRVPMSGPGDVSGVAALFDRGNVDPRHVVAIMEQTEGDPYARGYATLAMEVLLSERLGISRAEVFAKIPMMMIGGVGGIIIGTFANTSAREIPRRSDSSTSIASVA